MKPLSVVLFALAACEPQYDPCFTLPSEISRLQVLAIRADPPEATLNADGSAPSVQVRALIVDTQEQLGESLAVTAAACVPTDTRVCAEPHAPASQGAPGEHAFVFDAPQPLLQQARAADPLAGYGGVRVQLQLAATARGETVRGEKLLLYSPPGAPVNHGFEITGLRIRRYAYLNHQDESPFPPADQVLRPGEPLLVDVGDPIWIDPVLSDGAQESYAVTDLSGAVQAMREQISYSFYTSPHVELDPSESSEPDPGVERPPLGLTRYRYLKVHGGEGQLHVVARDSRGAQAWFSVRVTATDRRGCSVNPPCPILESRCL